MEHPLKIDLGGLDDWWLSNECTFHQQISKPPGGDTFWVSFSLSLLKDCENFRSIRAQGALYSRLAAKYSKANLRVWEQLHGNLSTDFSGCIRLLCGSRFLYDTNKELFVVLCENYLERALIYWLSANCLWF